VCTVHTRMYLGSHCIFYAMELFTLSMTEQTDDPAFCSPLGSAWRQTAKDKLRISASLLNGNAWMKEHPVKECRHVEFFIAL